MKQACAAMNSATMIENSNRDRWVGTETIQAELLNAFLRNLCVVSLCTLIFCNEKIFVMRLLEQIKFYTLADCTVFCATQ